MKTHSSPLLNGSARRRLATASVGLYCAMGAVFAQLPAPIAADAIGVQATAGYHGDAIGVEPMAGGARLHTGFQKLEALATRQGLTVTSTGQDAGSLHLMADAFGREGSVTSFPGCGEVSVDGELVRFARQGITEEYSVGVDGVRQDFIVAERPAGQGDLLVQLGLKGAMAQATDHGIQLVFAGSGRKLAYGKLRVSDAAGRELSARLEVLGGNRLAVRVEDAGAVYPVRIDPTFSDANWAGMSTGMNGFVYALATSGSTLYAGGAFTTAGAGSANYIAKWDGTSWTALGSGLNNYVYALAVKGGDLYVGGFFTIAGGNPANRIAKWDGSTWSALGTGMDNIVSALAVIGTDLYAGGLFTTAGGSAANRMAKWNGTSWSALGTGVNGSVFALAVSGTDLYVGGSFTLAGGGSAARMAKWNGSTWSALGTGMDNTVYALAFGGSTLYAGGAFTTAGGGGASRMAKWNGSTWSALGAGVNNRVQAIAARGKEVFVGGLFTTAGGGSANRIAKWSGTSWSAMGSGVNSYITALLANSTTLYAGGQFTVAGVTSTAYVAKGNIACAKVVVNINTDGNGNQITWAITNSVNATIATGGPTLGQNNMLVTDTVCLGYLPVSDCFGFHLYDSFGDGLGGVGNWWLSDADGRVLLADNFASGYDSPSTTPATPGYGANHSFCYPPGPANIALNECGIFNNALGNKVYCNKVTGATQYQFEFSDPDAGFMRRIVRSTNYVHFGDMVAPPLTPGVKYFARVRSNVAGPLSAAHFGSGCEMGLGVAQVVTCSELIQAPAYGHSCNELRAFNTNNSFIYAKPVVGATEYQFRIYNTGEGYDQTFTRGTYILQLKWNNNIAPPLVNFSTYNVEINVKVNGLYTGFCASTCTITIDNSIPRPAALLEEVPVNTGLWPNPVRGGTVNLGLDGLTDAHQRIMVDIQDQYGRTVVARELDNSGPRLTTALDLPGTMANGVYLVTVTVNGVRSVHRLSVVR